MKAWLLTTIVAVSTAFAPLYADPSAATPASASPTLVGVWNGVIGGVGNQLVFRIAGDPGRFTATTDSPGQGLYALPTGVAIYPNNNVTIKVDEPSPLTFNGVQDGDTIKGTWAEDTHSGPMTLTRSDADTTAAEQSTPHLSGTWEGVRSGIAYHYVFHIYGSGGSYRSSADSPDQNAEGLGSGVKMDAMNNVFLSIALSDTLYFTGVYQGDTIAGTWSQDGMMGEMTLTRQQR